MSNGRADIKRTIMLWVVSYKLATQQTSPPTPVGINHENGQRRSVLPSLGWAGLGWAGLGWAGLAEV